MNAPATKPATPQASGTTRMTEAPDDPNGPPVPLANTDKAIARPVTDKRTLWTLANESTPTLRTRCTFDGVRAGGVGITA